MTHEHYLKHVNWHFSLFRVISLYLNTFTTFSRHLSCSDWFLACAIMSISLTTLQHLLHDLLIAFRSTRHSIKKRLYLNRPSVNTVAWHLDDFFTDWTRWSQLPSLVCVWFSMVLACLAESSTLKHFYVTFLPFSSNFLRRLWLKDLIVNHLFRIWMSTAFSSQKSQVFTIHRYLVIYCSIVSFGSCTVLQNTDPLTAKFAWGVKNGQCTHRLFICIVTCCLL